MPKWNRIKAKAAAKVMRRRMVWILLCGIISETAPNSADAFSIDNIEELKYINIINVRLA